MKSKKLIEIILDMGLFVENNLINEICIRSQYGEELFEIYDDIDERKNPIVTMDLNELNNFRDNVNQFVDAINTEFYEKTNTKI